MYVHVCSTLCKYDTYTMYYITCILTLSEITGSAPLDKSNLIIELLNFTLRT